MCSSDVLDNDKDWHIEHVDEQCRVDMTGIERDLVTTVDLDGKSPIYWL
jgi:hypothetical protein